MLCYAEAVAGQCVSVVLPLQQARNHDGWERDLLNLTTIAKLLIRIYGIESM